MLLFPTFAILLPKYWAAVSYYFTDHLGSTQVVMDSNNVCTYNEYAPFGDDLGADTGERYKFTGKEDDGDTGLYYYNARYYDPAVGRFVSEDPVKDGVNWYVYCRNSSLVYVDPLGLNPWETYKTFFTEKERKALNENNIQPFRVALISRKALKTA